jgi:hypothetical protein
VVYSGRESRVYSVRFKPMLPTILDILEDELLADRISLYPEKRYVKNPDGGLMRLWHESSSGDDWWNLQVHSIFNGIWNARLTKPPLASH